MRRTFGHKPKRLALWIRSGDRPIIGGRDITGEVRSFRSVHSLDALEETVR